MAPPMRSSEAPYKVKQKLNSTTDDMVIKFNVKIVSFELG